MFDIGFSEILVIFVLALIVLGPEKLPKVVREVGRWVGRARAMARQFQEQLEEEVDLDRPRTIRSQPVRPVGGTLTASPPPLIAEQTGPAPSLAAGWQAAAEPALEPALEPAALQPGEPPEALPAQGGADPNPGQPGQP
ncbi:MAG TPA: Sec-independent protein translocase protein TatB [Steroidobacteraceae bacterium]|jgi:sec-independent protein translocase protein TatB|nr:Sec-independent protein translocase protein TatB [Steroidobacteraceae bacterium]